jgi:hypothetical protein
MADDAAQLNIPITATNQTEAGAKAAEKRLSQVADRAKKTARKTFAEGKKAREEAANDDEKANQRRKRSLLSYGRTARDTFATVEKAAARTFGTRSIAAGMEGAVSKVGNTLSLFSKAMGEAGEGASALELGAGAAATGIGAIVAAAAVGTIAAQKFGDAWAEAANKTARTAQVFGVNSQTMQAFDAVAQRFGAAKGVGAQAVTGISQGLNDAIYGDAAKRFTFRQAGIALRRNKDGSAIVDDTTIANIAESMSKRNNVGQRQIAQALGIPLDAIPAFIQGAKALRGQLGNARTYANVQSDASLAEGEARTQKSVSLGQIKDREVAKAGEKAASLTDGLVDTELTAAKAFAQAVDGNFKGSIDVLKTSAKTFGDAVDQFMMTVSPTTYAAVHAGKAIVNSASNPDGLVNRAWAGLGDFMDRIRGRGERSKQNQVSPKGATGVSQLMPGTAQWIAKANSIPWDEHRFRTDEAYNRMLGDKYGLYLMGRYAKNQTLMAAAYNAGPGNVDHWIGKIGDPRTGQISDQDFARQIPFKETRNYVGRVVPTEPAKVHVTVEVPNAPAGTRVTARTPGGAVSQAMPTQ